ncbi:low molecular weight phosphotyrosine protein phosphatase [Thalassococcus sp. CAU 1522]|uniref:protein-tyrosine-phosphatase n=1 Tax=Thalassococcus arenae TaxID=2851652 RepID=A0ABS6N4N6_9RHOB|nr:low molecular weight protein-tyrosine-phosphatase [Thalassococcus arenae]MBV2358500.1 low molecular weight phosphotyrosine protein phosphatase [Thalassococcus arenae]
MAHRILFVCLGNICRSPTAEAVLRRMARARDMALDIDSAGTGDWHIGKPPYGPMQDAARARGYDLSALRARQVGTDDFHRFDTILAMDADNIAGLARIAPDGLRDKPRLFTDFAPDTGADHVPDPYFTRDFEAALNLIEACAAGFLDHLERRR